MTTKSRGEALGTRGLLLLSAVLAAWPPPARGDNAPAQPAANDPAARFRGAPTYDFGVTNVRWEAATPEYSYVTFDLSWSFSWRAKWSEPAETSCNGKPIEVENWDAAWIFVKFLPEKDSKEAKDRNHWRHSTLDTDSSHHVMPAGAMNSLKLSDDGSRGMGVFIYRDAIGHGRNDWKGIKLRWLHGADKVDPAKAAIRVHPIAMVYVPEGPFKVGTAEKSGYSPFAHGPDVPITRYDGEESFDKIPEGLRKIIESTTSKDGGPYLQWADKPSSSRLTDGGWRGGPMIPFLLDAEWNAPVASGPRARRVGPVAGHLWSTHGFSERGGGSGGMFGSQIGGNTPLTDDYPTGYDAFYCMKYDLTQGQYVDFLNSLPPDVAAGRAFVGSEVHSDAGLDKREVKLDLGPGRGSATVVEMGGCTIYCVTELQGGAAQLAPEAGLDKERPRDAFDDLLADALSERNAPGKETEAFQSRPVYAARCPFRRLPGITGTDTRAYAVWAGLRPMSALESTKAGVGARDPAAPADWAPPPGLSSDPVLLDAGLPTERYARGNSRYGADIATRVGCRSTPASDRGTALATYWGISELDGPAISLSLRQYRGTHGGGTSPAGKPGASVKRVAAPFNDAPPDWPDWGAYTSGHFVGGTCRLVASANNRIKKPILDQDKTAADKPAARSVSEPERTDIIKVSNAKCEAGAKDYSTVSFDLAWDNSWRAKWEEPAGRNVTGKPMTVESWDAAWVFVKFRPSGTRDDLHATLSTETRNHQVPGGAALDVGLTDDGAKGVGVFIYRSAVGFGPNDFRNVSLRWLSGDDNVDPAKIDVKVHAIAMVYVPDGPFASRSPWGHALTVISTPEATKPGGHLESGPETVPLNDEFPNGFPAYYCMKYSITQGEYADFLNSIPSLKYNHNRYGAMAMENRGYFHPVFYNFNGYTITTNSEGVFKADVPNRRCNLLSLFDIQGYSAWAGLRMPTNLEYEKACRGPRAVAAAADAWTPATCAPAAGLDKSVLGKPPAVGPGPSYWGIRELSLSGCVQEWPSVIQNEAATYEAGIGIKYTGDHGIGSPEIPEHWPWTCFGEWYYGGIWRLWGYGTVGHWVYPEDLNRVPFQAMDANRTGRYGARAVRTAPPATDVDSPLVLDPLPDLIGTDIGIFNFSGSFRNDGGTPLKVELASAMPDACFPGGAASRAFTAAPKAVTSFTVLTVLTSLQARDAVRRGTMLPVQIRGPGGETLAKRDLRLQMGAAAGKTPAIRSLEGGRIEVRVKNATEKPLTVAIEMPSPPEVRIAESVRSVTVGAGADAVAAFPVPRQAFNKEGVCLIPYRVTVGGGAPLNGRAAAELRAQSRWWVTRRIKTGPKAGEPGTGSLDLGDLGDIGGMADLSATHNEIFKAAGRPPDWRPATHGAGIAFGEEDRLPSRGSAALAATRVASPADREAVIGARHEQAVNNPLRFDVRVWFNDTLVYDLRPPGAGQPAAVPVVKPFRIRKGANTLLLECASAEDGPVTPGAIFLRFSDAGDGKPVEELLLDMEQRAE